MTDRSPARASPQVAGDPAEAKITKLLVVGYYGANDVALDIRHHGVASMHCSFPCTTTDHRAETLLYRTYHKARKFSAVLGTASPNNPRTTRPPSLEPSISMSKNTLWVTFSRSLRRATSIERSSEDGGGEREQGEEEEEAREEEWGRFQIGELKKVAQSSTRVHSNSRTGPRRQLVIKLRTAS